MYRDDAIQIKEKLPDRVREIAEEIDKCYESGDEFGFMMARDNLEVIAKAKVYERRMNERDYYAIMRKYGVEY